MINKFFSVQIYADLHFLSERQSHVGALITDLTL